LTECRQETQRATAAGASSCGRMVEVYMRRALREIAGLPLTDYEIQVCAH
jgi:hypothetical protein